MTYNRRFKQQVRQLMQEQNLTYMQAAQQIQALHSSSPQAEVNLIYGQTNSGKTTRFRAESSAYFEQHNQIECYISSRLNISEVPQALQPHVTFFDGHTHLDLTACQFNADTVFIDELRNSITLAPGMKHWIVIHAFDEASALRRLQNLTFDTDTPYVVRELIHVDRHSTYQGTRNIIDQAIRDEPDNILVGEVRNISVPPLNKK